jgi:hypothetical protein
MISVPVKRGVLSAAASISAILNLKSEPGWYILELKLIFFKLLD